MTISQTIGPSLGRPGKKPATKTHPGVRTNLKDWLQNLPLKRNPNLIGLNYGEFMAQDTVMHKKEISWRLVNINSWVWPTEADGLTERTGKETSYMSSAKTTVISRWLCLCPKLCSLRSDIRGLILLGNRFPQNSPSKSLNNQANNKITKPHGQGNQYPELLKCII